MGALLSFGQDPRWRAALVAAVDPRPGERALDVACGTGMVTLAVAQRGVAEVIGLDQSQDMLGGARRKLAARPDLAPRVRFVPGEAERLPFAEGEFDVLTFTYLLRYVDDRAATLRELVRVLRPGGRIGMVEFGVPSQPGLRALWRLHTRIGLPSLGRLVSPAWMQVGRFLGPNIEALHRDERDLVGLWRAAGLTAVEQRRMSFGAGIVMSGVRAGS
jgi:demethylmenaquinone methyltransferase/2-methoxy-6-polyprenyl-1,4-benzoquinol methylase